MGAAAAAALSLAISAPAVLAASPTPVPTLVGPVTNPNPAPTISTRLLDAAGVYTDAQKAALADRLARIWRTENIDVIIGARVAPDRNTVDQTQTDAMNIGNNARVGVGARGGLVLLFNLDSSKCHGQAQLYADDRLRAILPNSDRQSIFDNLMKPKLKSCDLFGATTIALDASVSLINGDRSVLPAPINIDFGFWAMVLLIGFVGLFILIIIVGRFAAFPDARRRYRQMTERYQAGKDDPDTPTDNDDDFVYGAGHKHRHGPLDHFRNNYQSPDWSDPTSYPVYYGRPPGFWWWWFGVGAHTSNHVGGSSGGGSWSGGSGSRSSGGSWGSSGGNSSGGSWGSAGLAVGGFWSGIGSDLGTVASGVGQGVGAVLDGLADGSGGGGGFSGGGGAGGGF